MSDEEQNETHALVLPEVSIVMPTGALPVVREGTVGGIPAYEADPPKRPCGCQGNEVCLHGTPAILMLVEPTTRDEYLGIPRDTTPITFAPAVKKAKKKAPAKKKATRR